MSFFTRVRERYRRERSIRAAQNLVELCSKIPVVSFTFDDFPQSAASVGGAILEENEMRGTYYVSLGLMDRELPSGRAFSEENLRNVIEKGHELGCHTFAHCHAWETRPSLFEASIVKNREALKNLLPGTSFHSHSYPIALPRPETKRRAGNHYPCCRGGGETINVGIVDANNLSACFLEKNLNRLDRLKYLIDENTRRNGWLIFATHDVDARPTRFGCTPEFFAEIVNYAAISGAKVLPIGEAWSVLKTG